MQAVEQHPYVEQVIEPLAGDTPMGDALGEDAALEFLENEIMKIGSLSHMEIDWQKVEREAVRLLSDQAKDLKVLGFLLLALQRGGDGERFALSVHLLCLAMENWWTHAWPYPGDKGHRPRRLMFGQIMQRAQAEVTKVSFNSAMGDGRKFCLEALDKLHALVESHSIPPDPVVDLRRSIERLPAANEEQQKPAASAAPAAPQSREAASGSSTSSASSAAASLVGMNLDPGNDRATRQSLLKVADMLTEVSPTEPLGYQLRRFAIWHSISTLPPARDGVRSDLAAVSADRVAEYQESLTRGADLALWGRIEQSLAVSPFWLEGHYLSAQAAEQLGHSACAEAIRQSLKAFVDRLPKLTEMTFSDSTAFLPEAVKSWLQSSGGSSGRAGSGERWEEAFETAKGALAEKGLAPAMQILEDGLAEADEPRSQFYWRLMCADLLREAGMKTLAKQQVVDLREQNRNMNLAEWEPSLMAHLDQLS
ncbi:type VI secretion system protein TssA [Marinobacter sp. V034]|uniref:type VI secretion system protein TssA n=1 Tax=Marinobacter sp. V034 TaxID=3459610 RepID=UPI004044A2ED